MILSTQRIRGRRQFEVKQRVVFPAQSNASGAGLRYRVETWLFLPTALQVNRWSYSNKDFQQSLKSYLRLCPPTASLAAVLEPGGALAALESSLEAVLAAPGPDSAHTYENALKLCCLTVKRSLNLALQGLLKGRVHDEREARLLKLAESLNLFMTRFRKVESKADLADKVLGVPAFAYCHEYLCAMLTRLLRGALPGLPDTTGGEAMRSFWRKEMDLRQARFPLTMPKEEGDNELPLHRWSILKKYVDSRLFLTQRPKTGDPLLVHALYGLAAALAMLFATGLAFFWQGKYGALSTPLFLALVLGYILKDRMKEVFREKFFSVFRRWIPDRRQAVWKSPSLQVGICDEMFRFISAEKDLPPEVLRLRDKSHLVDVANSFRSEDVLYHSRDVIMNAALGREEKRQPALMDIARLDVSGFLRHAGDQPEEISGPDYERVFSGEKIYHLNLIRRITQDGKSSLARTRLTLNSEGIKRMEILAGASGNAMGGEDY